MFSFSSGVNSRTALARAPMMSQPSGKLLLGGTTDPAATRQFDPMRAPSRIIEPMPMRLSGPI